MEGKFLAPKIFKIFENFLEGLCSWKIGGQNFWEIFGQNFPFWPKICSGSGVFEGPGPNLGHFGGSGPLFGPGAKKWPKV